MKRMIRTQPRRAIASLGRHLVATCTLAMLLSPVAAGLQSLVFGAAVSGVVQAQAPPAAGCPVGTRPIDGGDQPAGRAPTCLPEDRTSNLNGSCDDDTDDGNNTNDPAQCLINKYVQPVIDVLAALVGITVTISIIVAGIQYASSADNSQKVSAAKQRIVTSVFVLIGFGLLYAFLNYIVPGGLLPQAAP